MSNRVLILGGGGREHALAESIWTSEQVQNIFVANGNAATAQKWENVPIDINNPLEVARFIAQKEIDLTLVGSENQLITGVVEEVQQTGHRIFGPDRYGVQLESSKAKAAKRMERYGVPTPGFFVTDDYDTALDYIERRSFLDYVIKADGPASGKGVILPKSLSHAKETVHGMMIEKWFGESGETIVFQDRVFGPELTVMVICDGRNYVLLPFSRDHKRFYEGGANTGGVAAYTPVAGISPELTKVIQEQFIERTLDGMADDGHPYKGALYVGLILTDEGPKAIEYNVRFGDPEFQAVSLRIKENLYNLLDSATKGELGANRVAETSEEESLVITLCAEGYPDTPKVNDIIHGLDKEYEGVHVFHGGTVHDGNRTKVAGGRVLHLASTAETIAIAHTNIEQAIGEHAIHFAGMQRIKELKAAA